MSSGYLLDTNVLSETRRSRPDARVVAFLESAREMRHFVSVMTIGELRRGAEMRARTDPAAAGALHACATHIQSTFDEAILGVDLPIATLWGRLSAQRPRPVVDTVLAATALVHDLVLVTRNGRDVADTGVPIVNPWLDG